MAATTLAPPSGTVEANRWAQPLYVFPSQWDYKVMHGGRGSSKTYEVTQALIALGHREQLRIAVAREHKVSIEESAQPELVKRAEGMGLMRADAYRKTKRSIEHANGTHIWFLGLSVVSEEDIKGLAMVDILWIEEAHRMSHSSWELVQPTIRKDDSEIWATFNPKYRTDAIWKFVAENLDDPVVWQREVNWRDNRFFTARNDRDRRRDKDKNPTRYAHIWEGQPDDQSEHRKVLPYGLLRLCVDAWPRRPKPRGAFSNAGLDVADTGADKNALAMRSGPEMYHLERWSGSLEYTPSNTARRAAHTAMDNGVEALSYDAGGVGSGIRGPLIEMDVPFAVEGIQFGGAVRGKDRVFIRGARPKTNGEYFFNWAAQAGWSVRMRAEMTQRLLDGEDIDAYDCLFINPEIDDLEDVLAQMAQPEFDDGTGKLRIDKQPNHPGEPVPPSPDAYDAVVLAFADDASAGLVNPEY